MQVLIVDDSGLIRERLREFLGEIESCRVSGAVATVDEALEEIPRSHPDLVILDIQLPDGEGLTVLEAAKRMSPAPLVAVLTNHYEAPYRQRYLDAGADFFWEKGKDLTQLLDAVRYLSGDAPADDRQ